MIVQCDSSPRHEGLGRGYSISSAYRYFATQRREVTFLQMIRIPSHEISVVNLRLMIFSDSYTTQLTRLDLHSYGRPIALIRVASNYTTYS